MATRLSPRSIWRLASTTTARTTPTPTLHRTFASSPHHQKTAIVTGSSRGIGKAIALRLAHDGYDVCVNDIAANRTGIDEVVQQIKTSSGRNAVGVVGDVSVLADVEAVIQRSVEALGMLDTMVANAGISQVKQLLETTEADFQRMFNINVFGMHNCYSAAAKQMIAQGNGTPTSPTKLISASSIVSHRPFPLLSLYSSSKAAVRSLNQAYALELAPYNITCNAYAPGIIGTGMWDLIDAGLAKQQEKKGERPRKGEMMERMVREGIAMGRVGKAEDVVGVVGFLAGEGADYMTGQCLVVDGGMVLT